MGRKRETYDDDEQLQTLIADKIDNANQYRQDSKIALSFHQCDFNVNFYHDKDLLHLTFIDCVFNGRVTIDSNIDGILDITNCVFNEDVNINCKVMDYTDIQESTFNNQLILKESEFIGKYRMQECIVKGNTDFFNVRFNDLADFWNSTFSKVQIFYKVDFMATTVFSNVTFKENVLFTYSLINKLILFRGTIFEKGLDLSLSILVGNIGTFDLVLNDFETKDDELIESDYQYYVTTKGIIPIKNKRETFTIIKNHLIKQNNIVESLDYRVLERDTLKTQIKNDSSKNKKVENLFDTIVLWLNKKSNNYGKSYWSGIKFTFIVGLIFFYLSLISTDNFAVSFNPENWKLDDFLKSFRYFFISLNPIHRVTYLDNEIPNALFYFWDFIGRIFIGYGIYQTIQAFRKFK